VRDQSIQRNDKRAWTRGDCFGFCRCHSHRPEKVLSSWFWNRHSQLSRLHFKVIVYQILITYIKKLMIINLWSDGIIRGDNPSICVFYLNKSINIVKHDATTPSISSTFGSTFNSASFVQHDDWLHRTTQTRACPTNDYSKVTRFYAPGMVNLSFHT